VRSLSYSSHKTLDPNKSALRKDIGKILRELCDQMGIELVEGHAMPDHVHLCLSIPPK